MQLHQFFLIVGLCKELDKPIWPISVCLMTLCPSYNTLQLSTQAALTYFLTHILVRDDR